jgi:hypothetical protein
LVQLVRHILPGTTLTLVRPGSAHYPWLGYMNLDMTFEDVCSEIDKIFKLNIVDEKLGDNVEQVIFGVEGR